MKNFLSIYAFAILGFLYWQPVQGQQARIKGQVTGDSPEIIKYSDPINGIIYWGFLDSVKVDAKGAFQIALELPKASFISIIVPNKFGTVMLIEPGQQYDVSIDISNGRSNFKVLDKSAEGQNLYASLPVPSHISIESRKFKNEPSVKVIAGQISKFKTEELSLFKALLEQKKISKAFFDLVQADRDCYYATLLADIILSRFYETKEENLHTFPADTKQIWGNIFAEYPVSQGDFMSASFWFEYAQNYVKYKEFTHKDFSVQKLREYYEQGLLHTHNIRESEKYLSGTALEYYQAAYIYYETLQKLYEKEFISIFEKFKKDWPQSKFTKYLQAQIAPIIEYHKKTEQPTDEKIKLVDNYTNLNSLQECLALFEGKKIYIDVWATWCGPCKDEFKHKSKLQELLKSKGYEVLYISIDDNRRDQQWKDMMKFYALEGYHIRANENLSSNLRLLFDQKGAIAIPWYMIVNKNGEIVKLRASRPSQLNALAKELGED